MIESDSDMRAILATDYATDCAIDPTGSPAGPVIRVLYDAPFMAVDVNTGTFASTQAQFQALQVDVDGVIIPESTQLLIDGVTYTVNRIEAVEGGTWVRLILNKAP